jgi:Cof subfamily protein (haloacid dehalogenase superfamily)
MSSSQDSRIDIPPRRSRADRPATDIRLVAVDLDGTLLDAKKQVSPPTLEAIRSICQNNVKVVIASARPPRSVRHIYKLLELDTWQINYNGAVIWDEPAGRVLFHRPISGKLTQRVIATARDMFEEVQVSVEILDRWYTDRPESAYTTETGRLFKPDQVAPLETFCNQPVTKLLFLAEPRIISRLEAELLRDFPEASVLRSDPELIQVMHPDASKAAALSRVARHYGVPMANVMAIGDAVNDIPMLQIAGVRVAMDNAHALVKLEADWVAPSNNDHGVHAALRRYGLCK